MVGWARFPKQYPLSILRSAYVAWSLIKEKGLIRERGGGGGNSRFTHYKGSGVQNKY